MRRNKANSALLGKALKPLSLAELETQLRPVFLAALGGDAAAYRLFLDTISTRLRGYIRQMLARVGRSEMSETEDVLQETLLAIHLSRHTYDPASPVTAWARAIARYKLVDHLRRTGRHASNLPIDDEAYRLAAPDEAASDAKLDLVRAMQALPERTRTLIDRVCPSSDNLRPFLFLRNGGSGSSGFEVMRPAADAASVSPGWSGA